MSHRGILTDHAHPRIPLPSFFQVWAEKWHNHLLMFLTQALSVTTFCQLNLSPLLSTWQSESLLLMLLTTRAVLFHKVGYTFLSKIPLISLIIFPWRKIHKHEMYLSPNYPLSSTIYSNLPFYCTYHYFSTYETLTCLLVLLEFSDHFFKILLVCFHNTNNEFGYRGY